MRLENAFEVAAPPEAAWALLLDVPRVVPCVPGAELLETVDEAAWRARIRVKLGPMALAFAAEVRRDEVDEAARRVRLATTAREERGRGSASATIESTVEPAGAGTRVVTVTELDLAGTVAQFGRGLVQGVAGRLLTDFAACLERQLAEAPPPAERARPVSALRLLWDALLGLFHRRRT